MIPKYIAGLVAAVLLVSILCTRLSFATHSQVLNGTTVEETWPFEFTLQVDSMHTDKITPEIQAAVERGIAFVAQGPAHIVSVNVDIAPQDVISKVGYESITASGAGGYAHVKWEAAADAASGAHGDIRMIFPALPGLGEPNVRLGSYATQDDQGHWILREVTTYGSASSVFLARLRLALALGLPLGILLQGLWWAFELKNEKRARIAALPAQGARLPRTFYPSPIKEWTRWSFVMGIFAFFAGLLAAGFASEGYMDSRSYWLIFVVLGTGALLGLISVYRARASVLTLRVDSSEISYARGRGELQWVTERWTDVLKWSRRSRGFRGLRREWLEIEFTDLNKKKLQAPQDTVDYAALHEFLLAVSAPAKSA
jgi:hypothetical protein